MPRDPLPLSYDTSPSLLHQMLRISVHSYYEHQTVQNPHLTPAYIIFLLHTGSGLSLCVGDFEHQSQPCLTYFPGSWWVCSSPHCINKERHLGKQRHTADFISKIQNWYWARCFLHLLQRITVFHLGLPAHWLKRFYLFIFIFQLYLLQLIPQNLCCVIWFLTIKCKFCCFSPPTEMQTSPLSNSAMGGRDPEEHQEFSLPTCVDLINRIQAHIYSFLQVHWFIGSQGGTPPTSLSSQCFNKAGSIEIFVDSFIHWLSRGDASHFFIFTTF